MQRVGPDLGLYDVNVRGALVQAKVKGIVQVGSIGSGHPDMDGLGIGIAVLSDKTPGAEVLGRTSLYTKTITSIKVNGIEQHPYHISSFPYIQDTHTRGAWDKTLGVTIDLLFALEQDGDESRIDEAIGEFARVFSDLEVHRAYQALAQCSEQGEQSTTGFKRELELLLSLKHAVISYLNIRQERNNLRSKLELFLASIKLFGDALIPGFENAIRNPSPSR